MPGLLDGAIALVTGAGSGIGEASAIAMAAAGARDRHDRHQCRRRGAHSRAAGENAFGFPCDVTDRAACDALAAKVRAEIGPIAVLVNNAGIIRRGKVTRRQRQARLGRHAGRQSRRPLQHGDGVSRPAARDAGRDHQYRLDPILRRVAEFGRLHDIEGRRAALDQGVGDRTRADGHPGQRDRPRLHRNAAQRRRAAEPRLHGELHRAHPARPHRRHRTTSRSRRCSSPPTWPATSPASRCRSTAAISPASDERAGGG